MSYNSSWHFSLGLILLMLIYRNVKSNELNEVGGTRRNVFMDIKHFFERIFNPHHSGKQAKVTVKKNTTTTKPVVVGITIKNKPKGKPAYYALRRIRKPYMKNKNDGLQSYLIEDIQKVISEIDIISKKNPGIYIFLDSFGKLFNIFFKAHRDPKNQYERSDDNGENYFRNKRRQKTNDLKTLIIIVTNKKKVHEEMTARKGLSYLGISKPFTKDNLNQTILREAYGVACIKVAVRKCYKALRRVNDIVCRTLFKCKSSFKSMFLLNAKKGCITGFDYTAVSSQTPLDVEIKYNSRTLADEKREKYVDACIPHMLPTNSNTVRKQIYLGNNISQIVKQILRDESDRKCMKASREACVIACIYARDEVCSTYICGKKKKKMFKRECKNECKSSYGIKSDSSDSGNSGSD